MTASEKYSRFILIIIFSFFIFSSVFSQSNSNSFDQYNPREIHQKLGEQKARALLDKRIAESRIASSPLVNTQTNYDMQFYDVQMKINDITEIIYGTIRFVALATTDNVTQLQIDLNYGMTVDSIYILALGNLSYSRLGDVVTVDLDKAYNQGETIDFYFTYHGHPTQGGLMAFSFSSYWGKKVMSSLSEPMSARTWWPCKDRMDDKADSFDIEITVDSKFYVASNGILDSIVDQGDLTSSYYYRERYPMATYLFSLAISDYMVWTDEWHYNNGADTMPIVHAVFPSNYNLSLTSYDVTPYALTVLSDKFGQYPFADEKYGHANFTWGGAMEHQTMSSMTGNSFGFAEHVIVHEMGHQWWGDLVTCNNWSHIWLNEGWASYSEALFVEERDGKAAYIDYMNMMDYEDGGSIFVQDTNYVWNIFSGIVYDKGAWVCHMLRGILGDSLFFEGIDAFMNSEYRYGSATTEQFRDVFEAATNVELDYFFEDWIYGTYRPYYWLTTYIDSVGVDGYDVYCLIRQKQGSPPLVFRMPIDLAYTTEAGGPVDTVTAFIDQREQIFKFNIADPLTSIELDPGQWILKKVAYPPTFPFMIISTNEDLRAGYAYLNYNDTIKVPGYALKEVNILAGAIPSGFSLDTNGIISGVTTDSGWFNFTVEMVEANWNLSDVAEFSLYVNPSNYLPGDADLNGQVDIDDIVMMIEYMFGSGATPVMLNPLDVNGDCQIDIDDIVDLVEYAFGDGQELSYGCAE